MKLIADARTMGSKPSGVGIYAFSFLKEMLKNDIEIILLSDVDESEEIKYMSENGAVVITYGKKVYQSGAVFEYFRFVRQKLLEIQPDVFWEPNAIIAGNLKGFRGKIIVTLHDMFPITNPQYFGMKYCLYFRIMIGRTIRMADVLIYNSNETRIYTEKYFKQACRKKYHVGYIIVEKQDIEHEQVCSDGIAELVKEEYFLYVGNMEKRKGVDILIKAYEKYTEKGGKNKLYLVGKRREKDIDILIDKAQDKLSGIKYVGYVGNIEKRMLFEKCTCFVFPSRAEGFGIGVLEAMQYGKPVIVSELPIFKEIVGECINYFDVNGDIGTQSDKLCNCMMEYNMQISSEAYENVLKRYSAEELAKRFYEGVEILKEK